jgi:hypothetical protein
LSHALYDNATTTSLAVSSHFEIDPAIIAPMIAAFRQAAQLNPTISISEIAGGRWLCLAPGRYTTLVALFSREPARGQWQLLQELHHDFELANANRLGRGEGRPAAEQFISLWALEKTL